jgi:hypothetical protein
MGLSHHWKRPTELPLAEFQAAAADCKKLFAGQDGLAGFEGVGDPTFDTERIAFNGKAPNRCEPFEVAITEFDRRGRPEFFGHCKTEFQSYDLFVKAALIVLNHHLTNRFIVFSDAADSEWDSARKFVAERLDYGMEFRLVRDVSD